MLLLIVGVALWTGAHFFRRLAPAQHQALISAAGEKGARGVLAGLIMLSVVLIVIGYRAADFINLWYPPAWAVHLNNLMMLIALWLFGSSGAKGFAARKMRHPMLTGFLIWCAAHLLVNGDLASLILFGGLALWGVGSILLINRQQPDWTAPEPRGAGAELRIIVITIAVFAVITFIHGYVLGVSPFPV